jgi:hypothetical protein
MYRVLTNIYQSKAPLMIVLRYALVGAIILMGIVRLRVTLILLTSPENFQQRDILQICLMTKALMSGMNPYTALNELASKFVGVFPFFPHPAPYPPFVAILFIPLLWLNISNSIIAWYVIEIVCLAMIAYMLTILWKGRLVWFGVIFSFFILLAWYPIMADLGVGQLSILLTLILMAALLALQRNRRVLAGVLIGLSVAIKLITWPLIIYLILKKDWRAVVASSLTTLGLNLVALFMLGIGPFMDYYLRVSAQVLEIYHKFWANFSMFTIGYRLFEGTDSAIFEANFHAPPLINLPGLAPVASIGLVTTFLAVSMVWAIRSSNVETSFAILVSLIVAISPIVWDHYFVIIIISLVVMLHNLVKHSFPATQTLIYFIIVLLVFLFNDRISTVIILLNGGKDLLQAHGNQITFASSIISWLPMLEIIILSVLLWRSEISGKQRNYPLT